MDCPRLFMSKVIETTEEINRLHYVACITQSDGYVDPDTGKFVLTEYYLLKRNYCCNSKCRHCPYRGK